MNTMKRTVSAGILFAMTALTCFADERGQAIVKRIDELEAVSTSRMRFEMSVYQADGGERRVFVIESSERGNGDSLVNFAEPKTIRGLRILSSGSDSWVFFPSTGRVRKIAGSSRSGSVQGVGGDFSYEDLGAGSWASDYDFDLANETDETWEGGFFKELAFNDYKDFSGKLSAATMEMRNTKTGSKTVVRLLEASFGIKLDDRLFDPARFDK